MRAIKSPLLVLFIFERHYHSDHTPCENVLNNTMAFAGITNTNPGVPAMQELPHRCIKGLNIIMGRMRRTLASAVYISTLLAAAVLWPTPLLATNYTVKSGGGGNFTTIQACANVAVAGDTCTVYVGSYAGWTQTRSGSAGSPITFTVNPADTVNITSNVNVTNTNYVTIGAPDVGGGCANNGRTTGAGGSNPSFVVGGCFIFINAGIQGPTCGSGNHTNHFHVTYNTSRGSNPAEFVHLSQGGVSGTGCQPYVDTNNNDNYIAHNDLNWNIDNPAAPFCTNNILVYGLRNLFEYNELQGTGAQHFREGGSFNIVRNNYAHDDNGSVTIGCSQSPAHIDFFFSEGNDAPSLSYSLTEGNVWKRCSNDAGNCKFSFSRANGSDSNNISETVISRYNYIYSLDGSYAGAGDHNDGSNTTRNWHAYNNTVATEAFNGSSGACGTWDSGIAVELNTICYNTSANGWSPFYFLTAGSFNNGNLAYNTICTTGCTWIGGTANYINELTYAALHNKNPLFANYPTDDSLQPGSPAIGAGVALTTASGAGTNNTSLTVADAHFFQPGWGPSDHTVQADWIRIGASTTAQISSINYSTNVITLANPATWSNGALIYLYKNSSGVVVLNGANPNIGGSVVSTNVSGAPAPPTGLLVSVQ